MDINALIQNFGFPISVSIACGWFIYKMYTNMVKENATREERNFEMLSKFEVSISKFADILSGYENKLSTIEKDVKDIKEVVNK